MLWDRSLPVPCRQQSRCTFYHALIAVCLYPFLLLPYSFSADALFESFSLVSFRSIFICSTLFACIFFWFMNPNIKLSNNGLKIVKDTSQYHSCHNTTGTSLWHLNPVRWHSRKWLQKLDNHIGDTVWEYIAWRFSVWGMLSRLFKANIFILLFTNYM